MMRLAVLHIVMLGLLGGHTLAGNLPENDEHRTLTIGLLGPFPYFWTNGVQIGSAIIPALKKVRDLQLLTGYEITWTWRDSACRPARGFRETIDIWQTEDDVDVLIGAMCSSVCEPVSLLAAAWNIPVVSYACSSSALSNKKQYPTFTRVVGTELMKAPVVTAVMEIFEWDRCAIITSPQEIHTSAALETKRLLEAAGKQVFYYVASEVASYDSKVVYEDVLSLLTLVKTVKEVSRFIVLYMETFQARYILLHAYDEGMLNSDDPFIFYGVEKTYALSTDSSYRPEISNAVLFAGMLCLIPRPIGGPLWNDFVRDLGPAFSDPGFDGYNNDNSTMQASYYAATLYDSILVWAHGVNRTLEEGSEADNGNIITSNILNSSWEGVSGTVAIDYKGDRKTDQIVSIIQPDHPDELVDLFIWHAAEERLEKIYKPDSDEDWSGIIWSGGASEVPSGVPPCGWLAELCLFTSPTANPSLALGLVTSVLGVLGVLAVIMMLHRKHRRFIEQQEIQKCIFNMSDLCLPHELLPASTADLEAETSTVFTAASLVSSSTDSIVQGTTQIKILHGKKVAVRAYSRMPAVATNNALLEQIRQIKQLSHETLNPFIGAAMDPFVVVIITQYSHRGSLNDIIADETVKLSRDFQISFMTDVVRGLRYLHNSAVEYHGHLTSFNCIVDSRWMCKITDYGFHALRASNQQFTTSSSASLLWTAPEVLRGEANFSCDTDVYSFGIIIQELLIGLPPYGANFPRMDYIDIIQKVCFLDGGPYRPHIDAEYGAWSGLAKQCWAEDPQMRPTCSSILTQIQILNGGELPDLIGTMIRNLQRNNDYLEKIVSRRSTELKEEKVKMEILLHELLPDVIADQLKHGKIVEPEAHDEVTIFISDIVGFTHVSARSSPLQIVHMLNKLYTIFDKVLEKYDVYKVATIGDAYMVVSGLPVPNGDRHASEIAAMSCELVSVICEFPNLHLEGEQLKIRIGIHSGPCAAGVTGTKTPRYLLFGKTVDVAARMEASGEAMKIHISQQTKNVLQRSGDKYQLELRDPISIPGIDSFDTYWLVGMDLTSDDQTD